jgi:hypothetical protein
MKRERSDKIPMVGKKYGHLTVVAEAGRRHYPTTKPQRLVLVRCDCEREYVTNAASVRRGVNRCIECHKEDAAERSRAEMSVRLPNGRTIAHIAQDAGLSPNTVYRRFLRGWPVDRLGAPLQTARRRKGYGGHVDLPERRCTVFPERRAS